MKNMNFMYLMDMIDDKYIVEAKMLPKVKADSIGTSRFTNFFSNVASVAAAVIVFGAIIIWTLVGKDILSNEQGDDTSNVTTTPIVTTDPDTEPDDPIVYSEGLEFALNEEKDGYSIDVNKGIGRVTVDGERLGDGDRYGNGPAVILLDTGVGSATVEFEQRREHE